MSIETMEQDFHRRVSKKVRLSGEGIDRYRVFTPFLLEDGDHLAIVLKREGARWVLSDEAHTYMHLSYDIDEKDLRRGTRQKAISDALSKFGIEDRDGELILEVPEERYGDALYSFIERLLDEGTHYFLSRPRRFGKSLFLDTLEELFAGSEDLFQGLAVHERWDWSVRHPVLRLDFAAGNFKEPAQVEASLMEQLAAIERRAGIVSHYATAPGRLASVLEALHEQAGRPVAVLVDEYDKPILDALDSPEIARANRDFLRGLYAVIKTKDAHIPYEWYTNNDIARYEGYYASVFYSYFAGLGLDIIVEDSTSHGRLDMAVRFNANVYLLELKVVELAPEGAAMAQLKEKGYAAKYRGSGEPVHLVGVELSRDTRNIVSFEVESA